MAWADGFKMKVGEWPLNGNKKQKEPLSFFESGVSRMRDKLVTF